MTAIQAILSLIFGAVAGIIFLGNLRDKAVNIDFIRHLLAADTIFPHSKLKNWAIKSEAVVMLAFWLVVGIELAITAFCLWGAYRVWLGDPPVFTQLGLLLAILLWFGGFRGAGELWGMWQSKTYNALPDAFQLSGMAALFLIIVLLCEILK